MRARSRRSGHFYAYAGTVCERMFPAWDYPAADAYATTRATDLREGMLDQMSRRDHDWASVARDTNTLAWLAHVARLQRAVSGDDG